MIKVYDTDTKKVTEIPEDELSPGYMRVRLEGVGEVFVDSNKLKQPTALSHPPFKPEVLELIAKIKETFDPVFPQTLTEWEDGFRKDRAPQKEILVWVKHKILYERLLSILSATGYKGDVNKIVFAVVISYVTNGPETALQTLGIPAHAMDVARGLLVLCKKPFDQQETRELDEATDILRKAF